MKFIFSALAFLCLVAPVTAQKTQLKKDTILVGHLMDSAIQKKHLFTEVNFGIPGGAFGSQPGMIAGRDFALTLEANFKVGFFPINRLLVGWTFTPYLTFSNLGVEGFRWSTGPFIRYYVPFYRIKKNKVLTSPFSLYVFFNANFGQYNPVILDRPFDNRLVAGIAGGLGMNFKISKNFNINIEFGPRYDFFASEFSGKLTLPFNIGFNFSFPSKREVSNKKYKQIQLRQQNYRQY